MCVIRSAELRNLGAEVLYIRADIGAPEERRRIIPQVRERLGRLHVLVNNAGVAPRERRDLLEASEESFEWVMRINLQGPYFLTQEAAGWMIAQKKESDGYTACIVNITSISAAVASVNRGEYCISKAGLAMATTLWAVRLAEFGIPVYDIRPGIIKTDMTAGVQAKYDALIAGGLLLQPRWGQPGDVGKAVAMLARGDLGYSTGQVLLHRRRVYGPAPLAAALRASGSCATFTPCGREAPPKARPTSRVASRYCGRAASL